MGNTLRILLCNGPPARDLYFFSKFTVVYKFSQMNNPMLKLSPEERLLLSLCRLEFSEEKKREIRNLIMEITDWEYFVRLANEHGIIALAGYNISQIRYTDCVPKEIFKILHNAYLRNLSRNTYLFDQLNKILELVKNEQIRVVLLKGMALEKTIYDNKGLRQMTDIDILVDQSVVMDLRSKFIKNGFKSDPFKSPIYKYLIPYLNAHLPRLTKDDCHLEIHYKLFDQKDNYLTEKLIEYSTSVKFEENSVFIPPPILFLLYLISHAEHHLASGDAQLRLYTDIYLLISSMPKEIINKQLINHATEAHLEKQLAGTLYLLMIFWGAEYPGWLNDFIYQYDHSQKINEFPSFLKQPKNTPANKISDNYIKQISNIPGGFNKALFLIGFICPSLSFMRKRYRTKTLAGAIFYYPLRWGRSAGLFFTRILKGVTAKHPGGSTKK